MWYSGLGPASSIMRSDDPDIASMGNGSSIIESRQETWLALEFSYRATLRTSESIAVDIRTKTLDEVHPCIQTSWFTMLCQSRNCRLKGSCSKEDPNLEYMPFC